MKYFVTDIDKFFEYLLNFFFIKINIIYLTSLRARQKAEGRRQEVELLT
jgi:hypothetical protein